MRITPLRNINYTKRPSFKSLSCSYKTQDNKEMGLYTWMFRNDVDWQKLVQFEIENFKDKESVNIIQFGASDGSEGYTKILSHLEFSNTAENKKFFPIQAFDINPRVLAGAQTGWINLKAKDIVAMMENKINVNKYFPGSIQFFQAAKYNDTRISQDTQLFKVPEEVIKNIHFNYGDMFKVLPAIKDNANTILMARNSLGYYPKSVIEDFVHRASKVLKAGSLFIVGLMEEDINIEQPLNVYGFRKIMRNVYKKIY